MKVDTVLSEPQNPALMAVIQVLSEDSDIADMIVTAAMLAIRV